jgi:hypothetical protein
VDSRPHAADRAGPARRPDGEAAGAGLQHERALLDAATGELNGAETQKFAKDPFDPFARPISAVSSVWNAFDIRLKSVWYPFGQAAPTAERARSDHGAKKRQQPAAAARTPGAIFWMSLSNRSAALAKRRNQQYL